MSRSKLTLLWDLKRRISDLLEEVRTRLVTAPDPSPTGRTLNTDTEQWPGPRDAGI